MDNVCHTLVGAAFGEAGLKQRTRFGSAALMISANIPDLDVLVYLTGASPVAFRRGITHGIVAQLLLPVLLTAIFVLVGKLRTQSGRDDRPPLRPEWLLVLAFAGVYSHVFLDWLNNYGVRLLTPFSWQWFYGDSVFIIDPWLWLILGVGVWLSRRRLAVTPARGALTAAACYILVLALSARAARGIVERVWRETRGHSPAALMVGPIPISPLTRAVIVDAGDHYETGAFSWWSRSVTFLPDTIPKNAARPEVAAATAASPRIRAFLVWSRFPYWSVQTAGEQTRVTVADMRFPNRGGTFFAEAVVPTAAPADRDTTGQ
jgi:inner membrane protein